MLLCGCLTPTGACTGRLPKLVSKALYTIVGFWPVDDCMSTAELMKPVVLSMAWLD